MVFKISQFVSCRSLVSDIGRLKKDYKSHQLNSEQKLGEKVQEGQEYQKSIKSLQNEKAVLSAGIEARDNKLSKLSSKLVDIDALKGKVVNGENSQRELDTLKQKYLDLKVDMEKMEENNNRLLGDMKKMKNENEMLAGENLNARSNLSTMKKEVNKMKVLFQTAKGERNNFKQKADSLGKEMSRICRNGLDIKNIENIIQEHQFLSTEVVRLRSEKKKAVHVSEQQRLKFEQYVMAQIEADSESNQVTKVYERNIELERLVTETTEYLNAKEMQLESVQEANVALTEELRFMADKYREQNDI